MLRFLCVILLLCGAAPLAALASPEPGGGPPRPMAPVEPSATFPLADPFDYSDVVLLGNNNSETSRNLTWHFQVVRGVPVNNVLLADLPVAETITPAQWATFASWFTSEMANRSLGADINYIVTFKGMPIRVAWTNPNGPTSFQDELMLLGGPYQSYIGDSGGVGYNNPYFNQTARFSFRQFGLRLVTGIYAYNESTAIALIDRAANSLGSRGEFVLDADSSKGMAGGWGGYAYANQALVWANASLTAAGQPVFLDTNTTYVTGRTAVMGYSSWGSNDCCWGSVTQVAKPQNLWVNGSIGETFVSTGGRTFTWPPSYGQSLIADWIDEGANGMKGYTDEPYIHSIADGHILHPRYVAGYNLAESFWAASHVIGWRQIVIGDPKMAPFADDGNLSINASLTTVPPNVLQYGVLNLTLGVDNTAALDKVVTATLNAGPYQIASFDLHARALATSTFDLSLDLAGLDASIYGPLGLRIRIDPSDVWNETNETDNEFVAPLDIRRPPIITVPSVTGVVWSGEMASISFGSPGADRPIDHFDVEMNGVLQAPVPALADNGTFSFVSPRAGLFWFNATAVDSAGLRSGVVGPFLVRVLNRLPLAVLVANVSQSESLLPVHFSAGASFDPDSNISQFLWDAGAAGNGSGAEFTITFPRPFTYVVGLTVVDEDGGTNSTSVTIQVTNRAPRPSLLVNATALPTAVPFNFSAAGSDDLDGAVVAYEFSFDDGTRIIGSSPWVSHAFAAPGLHTGLVRITDDFGALAIAGLQVTAENRLPTIQMVLSTAPHEHAFEGMPLGFALTLVDVDGNLSSCTIDFGDGARMTVNLADPAASPHFQHAFSSPGVHAVAATVTDEHGGTAAAALTVAVEHPAPAVRSGNVTLEGRNITVAYAVESPYSSLELWVVIDGATWRAYVAEPNGSIAAQLPELAVGAHTVTVVISDGSLTEEVGRVAYTVEAPSPPPPTGGGSPEPDSSSPLLIALPVAIGMAAIIGYFVWRSKRPQRQESSQDEQTSKR